MEIRSKLKEIRKGNEQSRIKYNVLMSIMQTRFDKLTLKCE